MTHDGGIGHMAGNWRGENLLWFRDPDAPERSEATAEVEPPELRYTWAFEGKPQSGVLRLSREGEQVVAVWTDTWHSTEPMRCLGTATAGRIEVVGEYSGGEETWRWRTVLEGLDGDRLRMRMYNVTPAGEEQIAVELLCDRADA